MRISLISNLRTSWIGAKALITAGLIALVAGVGAAVTAAPASAASLYSESFTCTEDFVSVSAPLYHHTDAQSLFYIQDRHTGHQYWSNYLYTRGSQHWFHAANTWWPSNGSQSIRVGSGRGAYAVVDVWVQSTVSGSSQWKYLGWCQASSGW